MRTWLAMLCAQTSCIVTCSASATLHPDAALDPDAPDALLVDRDEDGTSDDIDSCLASSEDRIATTTSTRCSMVSCLSVQRQPAS
ncbi:MAG: hypothetical protein IPQ07_45705 [Myxococcales bacterium]|nr:hypothetical protein [Myxococcales bacterium]